ncbi:hypothetical protein GH714_018076 [Hevea brasiliensis]|uniref:RNase H type-1 domain-containing protein n=1 Tax=Hevea brasiliensis TaxID=3981 RepID=A0A6A6K5F5_HEVBR|nr:hypothetical protein GH714_018076 [Hevea brasiliensis]
MISWQLPTRGAFKLNTDGSFEALVFLIKRFLSLEWQCELMHVYREANFSADYLANYAASLRIGLHIMEAPPSGVLHWLLHDSSGVSHGRVCV